MIIENSLLDTLHKINNIKKETGWKRWRIYYAGNIDDITYIYIPIDPYQRIIELQCVSKAQMDCFDEVDSVVTNELESIEIALNKHKFLVPKCDEDFKVINSRPSNMIMEIELLK